MAEKTKWIDKVVKQFMDELGDTDQHPKHADEKALQDKILTLIQYRAGGLDHRRMGLLAADLYRLMYKTRARIVEDLARVAVSAQEGGDS